MKSQKKEILSTNILNKLCSAQYSMANIEIVPYKSKNWKGSGLVKLFNGLFNNKEEIIPDYRFYLEDIFDFIAKYSDENTYIIMAGENKAKLKLIEMYNKKHNVPNGIDIKHYKIFSCEIGPQKIKTGDEGEKHQFPCAEKCRTAATISLCKWHLDTGKPRKVVLLPAISQRSPHHWLYDDVSNLVSAINKLLD